MKFIMLFLFLSFSVFSDEIKSIPYEKINDVLYFAKHEKKSPIAYLDVSVGFDENVPLRVWISGPQGRELALDNGYKLTLPLMSKADAKQHKLNFDRRDDKVSMSMTMSLQPPEGVISYQDLFIILDDMNNLIKKQVGKMSWLVPSYDTLRFNFSSSAEITYALGDKVMSLTTDSTNSIEMQIDKKAFKENPEVTLSIKPYSVVPIN